MSIFEQIKADREAGTDGPWRIHDCDSMGERCINFYQEIWNDSTDILVTTEVTRAHNDGGAANMRRIARVPQLERIVLAAEDMAEACQKLCQEKVNPATGGRMILEKDVVAIEIALTAFQEACK